VHVVLLWRTLFLERRVDSAQGRDAMSERAEGLARRIEQGAAQLAALAEQLTEAEWQMPVQPDGRTVGVMMHHVASVYPLEVQIATRIAAGQNIEGVTWQAIREMNAGHAHEHAHVTRPDTIALLRTNSQAAAQTVRTLTDDQLDRATLVSLYGDAPLTAQFFIEDHALRHSWHHLAKIRAALASRQSQVA
jgi:hypothetical protein